MGSFWKSVISVLSGTAMAQAIPIAGSIVIARQYAPAAFGEFSAWLGVVMLLAVVVTGRFETALAIEADGDQRKHGVIATLITTCLATAALMAVMVFVFLVFPSLSKNISISLILLAAPTALVMAISQVWQSWAAAEGSFKQLSYMRIISAAVITLGQLAVGVFYPTTEALVYSSFFGAAIGCLYSIYLMPVKCSEQYNLAEVIKSFWLRNIRFPQYSLPADSINTAASQLPILIVTTRFGPEVAGLLAMTMKILGAPIGLLGKSVLDVFKRYASSSYRERGECREEYLRTFKVLGFASIIFSLLMVFFSESFFAFTFGESWRESGVMAIWLLPLFALRFIASPLSYMIYIAGKQHVDLFWQIALMVMTVCTLYIFNDYKQAIIYYSVGYGALYIIYLAMSYEFSKGRNDSNN